MSWWKHDPQGGYRVTEAWAAPTEVTGHDLVLWDWDGDEPTAVLAPSGMLTVLPGFWWDGASGPAIDTRSFMRASCAHDALYRFMRSSLLAEQGNRRLADRVMFRLAREDGMWWPRAVWCYLAVRWGAWWASHPIPTDTP